MLSLAAEDLVDAVGTVADGGPNLEAAPEF
jgi:hypothetical protein